MIIKTDHFEEVIPLLQRRAVGCRSDFRLKINSGEEAIKLQTDNFFLTAWDDIDQYVEFLCCDDGQVLIDEYKRKNKKTGE